MSDDRCRIPQPDGWACTRHEGHHGPCALVAPELVLAINLALLPGVTLPTAGVQQLMRLAITQPDVFESTWRVFADTDAAVKWAEQQPGPMVLLPLAIETNPFIGA